MPESVRDRPTRAHEYIFLLTKSPRYFYDADAIREPLADSTPARLLRGVSDHHKWAQGAPGQPGNRVHKPRLNAKLSGRTERKMAGTGYGGDGSGLHGHRGYFDADGQPRFNPLGRNKRTVWTVTTKPFKGAHFATFPPDLIEPCVLAGTSTRGVCPHCGAPYVRSVERTSHTDPHERSQAQERAQSNGIPSHRAGSGLHSHPPTVDTVGWHPSCDCAAGEPIPATVLDPFSGAGTTGLVAVKLGRAYIGIDVKPEYVELSRERLAKAQPWLFHSIAQT
jgi:hypothetical protein